MMVRRCAWCDAAGTKSDEPDGIVTHGICAEHRASVLRDFHARRSDNQHAPHTNKYAEPIRCAVCGKAVELDDAVATHADQVVHAHCHPILVRTSGASPSRRAG